MKTTNKPASKRRKASTMSTMSTTPNNPELVIGLVSVSDRASGGVYEDKGIPALADWLSTALTTPFRIETRLIPDERAQIERTLVELVDQQRCHLVLTTGGTGPARRDVTPEATLAVATKEMPGFGEQMRQISLQFVPTAILSRQLAVIRETPDHAALIMNLPGQPKAIKETLEGLKDADGKQVVGGIFAAVPYCVDLIGGPYMETDPAVCKAFRPKSALRPQP
jgi:molybdopterin adenylyltransferase